MRIAVTGSVGQVGSRLAAYLRKDHDVTGFDIRPGPGSRLLDVASAEATEALQGFEAIFHLAAAISVAESMTHPSLYVRSNVLGTVQVLDAARRSDARVVVVSTAAVYGQPDTTPIPETHPRRPESPYGLSKVVGEEFAELFHATYGLDVSIVRPFNIYSEDVRPDNPYAGVIAVFLRNARAGRPLEVQGDGGQTRDFVHVSDVVRFLGLLADHKGTADVFNCATGRGTSILELAELVRARFGSPGALAFGPARAGDIRHSVADISRARRLGYEPKVGLPEWIRTTNLG